MTLKNAEIALDVAAPTLESPASLTRTAIISESSIEIRDISVNDLTGDIWEVIPVSFDFSKDRLKVQFLSSDSFTYVGTGNFNGYKLQFSPLSGVRLKYFALETNDSNITLDAITGYRTNALSINVNGMAFDYLDSFTLLFGFTVTGTSLDDNLTAGDGPDIFSGLEGNDIITAFKGADTLDGGAGNDLLKAGNGADTLKDGTGTDELWGGFGLNTFETRSDGFNDLIVIKSDHHLVNPLLGRSGNNADGSKCDIIQSLDAIDQIVIQGVDTSELTLSSNSTAHGQTGIGIFARGVLEALYTGGDLSLDQLAMMTSGDSSTSALNGSRESYWF